MSTVAKIEFETIADLRDALVQHRVDLGLTQKEMGERMGMAQGSVSLFERGARTKDPSYASVQRYAEALGVGVGLTLDLPEVSTDASD